jgi:two-component system cell cycle sensor histidine kinase/response regulator CckA
MGRKLKGQSIDPIPNQFFAEMGHRLFTAASDAMFVVNGAGEFVEVNAAGCEMVGRTHQALLRLSLPDLFSDGRPFERLLERPLPDKTPPHEITGQYTTTLRSKNGRSLSVDVETHPLMDGRFLLIIRRTTPNVLTGRQQAGVETRDLAKFPSENPYPVMRAAQDGVLLYANPASASLLENWGCTVGQRLPETWRQHVLDTLASGLPKEVETAVADRVFSLIIVPLAAEGYVNVYGYDVTDRKQAGRKLRESQEQLAGIIASTMDAIVGFDESQNVVLFNPAAEQMFGRSAADVIGQPHNCLLPERYRAAHRQHIQRFSQTGMTNRKMSFQDTLWALRADGQEFPIEASISQVKVGEKMLYTAILRDVTERKQAEEKIRDLQDILTQAETVARIGSWKWDLATQKVTWSDEMYDIFAVDRENFDGDVAKVINNRIHPDDIEAVNQSNLSVLENLKPLPLEYRIVLPDGTERVVWAEGRINHDQSGDPAALVGYVQDITERKQTEKALRESEERYHRTLENMLEGCQIIGFDWRYLYLNASVVRHGRRSQDELLGRTMMEAYPGIERTELFATLRRCMAERTANFFENKFDYDDGSFAWFELSIQPVPEGLFILSIDITERKRATEALWQSEERFSKAFHLSPAALSLAGSDGRIIDVNENYERMTGYYRDELIGRDGVDLNILTRQQRIDLSQKMLEQGGNLREAELTVRTKSGEMRDVLYSVGIVEIEGKECALTLAFDITERKQMQTTLQEMVENMAAAQQMTHYGSWEVRLSADLEFIDPQMWSDECYRIFGVEPGSVQITSDYFYSHVHPDDREAVQQALWQAVQNRAEAAYEYRLIWDDGSIHTIYDRVKVVLDEGAGRPVKVVGIVQDVTERRQAEATIAGLHRRMELILNSAGEGIYGSDMNGRITFVNPAMGQMTGWEPDELLGRDAHAVFHHTRADGTAFPTTECGIHHAMQEGRSYHADSDTYWRKDGTPIAVEHTSTPIWEDGQVAGMVMVVKDITERKRAAKEQALLEEQLRQAQKMESIGRLAGGVAHDFNNQLTIIQLYSDLMRSKMAKDDPLLPKLEQIRQAGDHAAGLTRQLLAFSRKQILQPVTLDLNDLVMKLHKMLARLIGEDITLSTALEPGLWPVTADSGQIEQVIMNLVVNARDAMPVGGLLTIETSNLIFDERITGTHLDAPLGPCVMLAVTDTGQGMDEVTRKQIFEPFFTTKQADKGTGLGLATVHGVIKQSGGAIFVYSELGQGTTFKIYLPANANAFEQRFDSPVVTTMQHGSETILLVEDEIALRDLVRITLQEVGYTVLEADDSSQALGLVEQYADEIDLLLTDVVMPRVSGRDLAQALSARRPGVKVLFMSGYMDDDVLRHGLLTAEVEFLSKPFTRSTLASKVRSVLDKP